jgi:hypothetical protein
MFHVLFDHGSCERDNSIPDSFLDDTSFLFWNHCVDVDEFRMQIQEFRCLFHQQQSTLFTPRQQITLTWSTQVNAHSPRIELNHWPSTNPSVSKLIMYGQTQSQSQNTLTYNPKHRLNTVNGYGEPLEGSPSERSIPNWWPGWMTAATQCASLCSSFLQCGTLNKFLQCAPRACYSGTTIDYTVDQLFYSPSRFRPRCTSSHIPSHRDGRCAGSVYVCLRSNIAACRLF